MWIAGGNLDPIVAEAALRQIEAAYETTRLLGEEPTSAYFYAQRTKALSANYRVGWGWFGLTV